MTWLFIILAVIAFVGFGLHADRRNGYGMVCAAALIALWVVAALWWSGRF